MSGWESYYKTKGDEEEEEEESPDGENELTPFDMSIQCIESVYTSKIISSDRDLLGVVFYGTKKDKNSVNFKNIYVLQELDNPGAKQMLELDQCKGQQGQNHFQDLIGHRCDYSLSEVLWVCANLFSDVQVKMSHKRIMLFTNDDDPHGSDNAKASQARTKASDLRDTGIFLDLMHLKKHGGFDISLFYREEELDDQKIQVMANPEQLDKMKAIVQKLHFKYRSDSFENPVLQQNFRNLEALALDLMEPEQAVDLTLPKVEAMHKRLGSLVDEFKDLVYPPDYNPEGKATKKKQDGESSGSKRPNTELSKEELKVHATKGTLGKLTVPMLKEACRVCGLKGGLKKQELLDAFTQHFLKD
ncbi:ATP-dependent DNA helicase 2 subunit 1 [Heterocephalus glaber]|uniref:DNA helicase n=1 Tax=Heterocephalus glaber TaxID=10181 RepID=G5BH08_HETGA|nr:ATP-dependent DNA helicase 2 subunit 1 [Heterocephalus glaber]